MGPMSGSAEWVRCTGRCVGNDTSETTAYDPNRDFEIARLQSPSMQIAHAFFRIVGLRSDGSTVPTGMYLLLAVAMLSTQSLRAQDLSLNPTRPTIANSAGIQAQGVLQVEAGYDVYPQSIPGNQQTLDTLFTYTPLARLRLDFDWAPFNHQQSGQDVTNGIGTIQIGGKVELKKEDYHRPAPGFAIQYEAELPTASRQSLQGYGQQIILLANHHYGNNGDLDVLVNGSLVQADCQTVTGCNYGGQQSVAISYHLQKSTRLYVEAFAQNVSQSNTPPGTYIFTGFYHAFSDAFGLDGGMRFGVSDHSASVGTTIGVVFGKRLQGRSSSLQPIRR
jgi:hypothetical protein